MKIREIFQIIVIILLGALIMFYLQPLLYDNTGSMFLGAVRFDKWFPSYNISAIIIYTISVLFTVGWYILSLINQNDSNRSLWKLIWLIGLGLLTLIISITIAIYNRHPSGDQNEGKFINETLLSLIGFFLFDSLFFLYWLPTATSTPGLFKNGVVPGSRMINGIIGRK